MSMRRTRRAASSVGKWADFAVLSADYLTVPEDRISQLSSVLTMVGGKVVHGAGKYASRGRRPSSGEPGLGCRSANIPATRKARSTETGASLAAAALQQAIPTVIGGHGCAWTLGCGCGLL